MGQSDTQAAGIKAVQEVYESLLASWNRRSAKDFAAHFSPEAYCVGFDGSPMSGREEILKSLAPIFKDHPTAAYVSKTRGVAYLADDVMLLRAVAGMVPPGKKEIMPDRNAVQSVVAVRDGAKWLISLFQNTPARFDGRPELAKALTEELQRQSDAA